MIKKKLITVVAGTRPNLIKVAPLIRAIKKNKFFRYRLVYTQQHRLKSMSQVFFKDLGIPKSSNTFKLKGKTQLQNFSNIIKEFELDCLKHNPHCIIVVGDVDTTLACSLVANKLNIYLAHVEAGLRSNDFDMPEEINRIITDSVSDIFFATEKSGVLNLIKEGHDKKKIHYVGNVMIDNLYYQKTKLKKKIINKFPTNILKKKLKKYAVLTLHRPSNVDKKNTLVQIIKAMNKISKILPIIFPVHPRTKKNINKYSIIFHKNIFLTKPLPYMEFLNLWKDSEIVLTDSGGLQEETSALGIKCITIRENTERPITLDQGTNTLAGTGEVEIYNTFKQKIKMRINLKKISLWDGNSSKRIVKKLYETKNKMY
tara:strand:- start:1238 stop:2350 length:1113 start_codon:yes stop_codon:yes gene_type:complete